MSSAVHSHKKDMDQIEEPWSPEEDEKLENLVKIFYGKRKWSRISKSIPGRSSKSCMLRWHVKKKMDQIAGPWSPEEDDMLHNLVKKHGPNWKLMGKSIPGRTGKSCCSRWSFIHRPFKPEEDEIILRFHARIGDKWADIGLLLSARPVDVLKNRWNSTLKWKSSLMTNEAKIQGQAPSISDMARENMSSGSTHSYSHDESPPRWNALRLPAVVRSAQRRPRRRHCNKRVEQGRPASKLTQGSSPRPITHSTKKQKGVPSHSSIKK